MADASPSTTFSSEATHVSGRRFIAHLLDGVVYSFLFAVLAFPFAVASDVALLVYLIFAFTVGHVAFVLLQARSGQTPGKRIAGIRVVDRRGEVPSKIALTKRSIPLLIEYLYIVAFTSMMSSPYRQRLGDRWGDTFVISATRSAAASAQSDPGPVAQPRLTETVCKSCGADLPAGTAVCPICGRVELAP